MKRTFGEKPTIYIKYFFTIMTSMFAGIILDNLKDLGSQVVHLALKPDVSLDIDPEIQEKIRKEKEEFVQEVMKSVKKND